ncbi:helix-turn-helix domain-containing protein [Alistipes sp.]|uniref:helix-turn-helix domain-containing protein n=1 Tax=Alistipes sp. TaxID=1872444 RepID=UPI0025BD1F13|nr:helix-turn-helix domain-containing protein [Alistipes sp.]
MSNMEDINNRLDRIERLTLISSKTVLDIKEAAAFTGYSESHIYNLTSRRAIPHYKKNRKLYFRKTELEEWLLERQVKTNREIKSEVATYVSTYKKQ